MTRDAAHGRLLLAEFGRRVRSLREQAGLTQEELAKSSNMHRVTIARVEAGTREVGLTSIIALARGLSVDVEELLRGFTAV